MYLDLEKVAKEKEITDCINSLRERRTIQKGEKGTLNLKERLILEYIASLEKINEEYKERLNEYDSFFVTLKKFLPRDFNKNTPIA
jgi:hypothetical protein